MRSLVVVSIIAALSTGSAHADDPQCQPSVAQACFRVHGALIATNGTPSFRIVLPDTKRILGVVGGEEPSLPVTIRRSLGDDMFSQRLWGDYEVCPQTQPRNGEMQTVCLRGGENLKLAPR